MKCIISIFFLKNCILINRNYIVCNVIYMCVAKSTIINIRVEKEIFTYMYRNARCFMSCLSIK